MTISGNTVDTISSKWMQSPNFKAEFKFRVELTDINMKIQMFSRPILSSTEGLIGQESMLSEMDSMGFNPLKRDVQLFKYFEKLDVNEKTNLLETNSKTTPLNVITWQEERLENTFNNAFSFFEFVFKNKSPTDTDESVITTAASGCGMIARAIQSNFDDAAKKINDFIVLKIKTDEVRLAANKNFLKQLDKDQKPLPEGKNSNLIGRAIKNIQKAIKFLKSKCF